MQLFNDLYSIISADSTSARYSIVLNPEHAIYKAHFPGNPITPGVCTIQIAQNLLCQHLGRKLTLVGIKNVKFLQPIVPSESKTFDVVFKSITSEQTTVSATVDFLCEHTTYARLSLSFSYDS